MGIREGQPILDLDYAEDSAAAVDMNVVMTGAGRFVEVQGSGEEATFTEGDLSAMLQLARRGIGQLIAAQREALGACPGRSADGRPWSRHSFGLPAAHVPGFFSPQLCRISTLPSDISDHPIHSGGWMTFLIGG